MKKNDKIFLSIDLNDIEIYKARSRIYKILTSRKCDKFYKMSKNFAQIAHNFSKALEDNITTLN